MIGSTGLECPMTWMIGLRDVHDVFAGRLQNFRDAFEQATLAVSASGH